MTCHSECDCGDGPVAIHDRDCRSLDVCDGERGIWCEKHWQEQLREHGWLKGMPSEAQIRQDMIDSGRGHLLPDVLADRIDMARMREKDR